MARDTVNDPELGVLTWHEPSSTWEGHFQFPSGARVRLTLGNEEDSDIKRLLGPARRFLRLLVKHEERWRELAARDASDDLFMQSLDDDPRLEGYDLTAETILAGLSPHTIWFHIDTPDSDTEASLDYELIVEGSDQPLERRVSASIGKKGKFQGACVEEW